MEKVNLVDIITTFCSTKRDETESDSQGTWNYDFDPTKC